MKAFVKSVRNGAYDMARYLRRSGTAANGAARPVLRAHVMMDTHRVEKGMALPVPRPGFGRDAIARLIANLRRYEAKFGRDFATDWARTVLARYVAFNAEHGTTSETVSAFLAEPAEAALPTGGLIEIDADSLPQGLAEEFRRLALSRHSVRQFGAGTVDPGQIRAAAEIAAKTPSVCNRQSGRIHHVTDPELKRRALEIQGGNRGFGETIPDLLIVTSDLSSFLIGAERYQCWVDGGLFAMSVVYALHSMGLGTCMLNWSVDPSRDRALRAALDIPVQENVIVFIAVGPMPERLSVAASPRMTADEILRTH